MKFGAWIRAHRLRQNLSMDRVCKGVNLSKAYLSLVETGKAGPPKDKPVAQIAKQLDLDKNDLLARAHRERFPKDIVEMRKLIAETRETLSALSSSTKRGKAPAATDTKQTLRTIGALLNRLEKLSPDDSRDGDDKIFQAIEDLRVEERGFVMKVIKEMKALRRRSRGRSK